MFILLVALSQLCWTYLQFHQLHHNQVLLKKDTKDKERKVKQNEDIWYGSLWDAQWKTMQGFQIPPTWDIVYRCITELPFAPGTFVSDIVQSRLPLLLYNYFIYLPIIHYFKLFAAKTNKPKPLFMWNPNRMLWPAQDPSLSRCSQILKMLVKIWFSFPPKMW